MESKLKDLKMRLLEIDDLSSANRLLSWDQSTYMPPGGAEARGRQMATLSRLAHEKFVDPAIGGLLDDLRPYEDNLPYESDERSLIRVTRRGYERATQVPPALIAEIDTHAAASYQAWTEARPADDFARMRPYLEKTIDLCRKLADCFPGYEHIADPLIDYADYGMKATTMRALFNQLRLQLTPIVQAISAQVPADDACLRQHFPEEEQLAFGREVIQVFGYDFRRGRQDMTHHPFQTEFSLNDVRITTRVKENDFGEGFFSTTHECGHALYHLGIDQAYEGTPLAIGASAGVHESQSRTWENLVSRSRPFWEHFYPRLQAVFPAQLKPVSLDTFYRAINKVQRSLIRTEADEVTYNLHPMIRFEFELQLLEGSLEVKDLPEAWHAAYQSTLGVRAPDDADGVLQDVHWFGGTVGGAFQGYTLGNILSVQFFEAALQAHPEIPAEMRQGRFDTLHTWLKENIYRHGSKFTATELVERVTGGPMTIEPYIHYLKTKYGELYRL